MCDVWRRDPTFYQAEGSEHWGRRWLIWWPCRVWCNLSNPQMCQESTQNGFYNPMCRSLSPFSHESSMWGTHVIYRLWVSVSQQRPCVGLSLLYPACFQTLQSMSFVRSSDPEASVVDHSFLLSPSSLGGGSYTGRLAGVQGFPFLCIWTKLI